MCLLCCELIMMRGEKGVGEEASRITDKFAMAVMHTRYQFVDMPSDKCKLTVINMPLCHQNAV